MTSFLKTNLLGLAAGRVFRRWLQPTQCESLMGRMQEFRVVIGYPYGRWATETFTVLAESAEYAQQYAMNDSFDLRGCCEQYVVGVVVAQEC